MTHNPFLPNFTQVPNVLFDEWQPKLSSSEFSVLMVICRKTYGWHKTSDSISKSQLCKATGLSKKTVIKAITSLISLDLLLCEKNKNEYGDHSNTYSLKGAIRPDTPSNEADEIDEGGGCKNYTRGGGKITPGGVEKLHPQKKDLNKNINKVDYVDKDAVDDSSNDEEGRGSAFVAKWQFLCQCFPDAEEQVIIKIARSYAIESLKTAFNWTQSQNPEKPIAYYQWALKNPTQWLYKANKPKEKIAKDQIEELQEKKARQKEWFREFVIKHGIGQYSDNLWVVCADSLKIKGEKKQYVSWLENGFREQIESIFRKEGWI